MVVCTWAALTSGVHPRKLEPKLEPIVVLDLEPMAFPRKKSNEFNGRGDRI